MTGLWFLPARPLRLNTNEWMNEWMKYIYMCVCVCLRFFGGPFLSACLSVCILNGFSGQCGGILQKKKLSTHSFFIRDHFTCVSALMSVPICALRVPNFCHTFDTHTSCENLMCQKWKFGAPYNCVFPCTLPATPLLSFIGTMPKL